MTRAASRSTDVGGHVLKALIPLISVAVATTLLPVILFKFGHRLDWPHIRSDERASRSWTRWAELVVLHRWIAAATAVAVLATLAVAATSLHLCATTGEPNTISQSGDAKQGLSALERSGIGSGVLSPIEIVARGDPALLTQRLQGIPGVEGPTAPSAGIWRHGQTVLVDVFAHTDSSATVDRVRDGAHRAGSDVRVGGIMAQNNDFISATYDNLPLMIALIALLTFVLLARAFRSVVLPVKAVLLSLLSLAAAWGVLTSRCSDGGTGGCRGRSPGSCASRRTAAWFCHDRSGSAWCRIGLALNTRTLYAPSAKR